MTVDQEMERVASVNNEKARERAEYENSATCNVCRCKEYVQKFRNVVGKVEGEMQGSFSLFGGSVSGYISGSTSTLPVLSCRECGNEKTVATWELKSPKSVFWDFMHQFYFMVDEGFSGDYTINPFFLERPVETRNYMLENRNYDHSFYDECPYWSTDTWAKAGFKIPKIKKRHFVFFEKEVYPTWEELNHIRTVK